MEVNKSLKYVPALRASTGRAYARRLANRYVSPGFEMNRQEFESKLKQANPIGSVMKNPGGGTSEIVAFADRRMSYIRGSSTISVSLDDLYHAYTEFRGRRVSSSDLKSFAPSVFDSAARPSGHSCNCTFFFLALERAALASDLKGEGVRGSPYSVQLVDA